MFELNFLKLRVQEWKLLGIKQLLETFKNKKRKKKMTADDEILFLFFCEAKQ